jgi:hypothetical protein
MWVRNKIHRLILSPAVFASLSAAEGVTPSVRACASRATSTSSDTRVWRQVVGAKRGACTVPFRHRTVWVSGWELLARCHENGQISADIFVAWGQKVARHCAEKRSGIGRLVPGEQQKSVRIFLRPNAKTSRFRADTIEGCQSFLLPTATTCRGQGARSRRISIRP